MKCFAIDGENAAYTKYHKMRFGVFDRHLKNYVNSKGFIINIYAHNKTIFIYIMYADQDIVHI